MIAIQLGRFALLNEEIGRLKVEVTRLRERTEQAERALEAIRLIIEERLEADTSPGNRQQMRCAANIIAKALNRGMDAAPAGAEGSS